MSLRRGQSVLFDCPEQVTSSELSETNNTPDKNHLNIDPNLSNFGLGASYSISGK